MSKRITASPLERMAVRVQVILMSIVDGVPALLWSAVVGEGHALLGDNLFVGEKLETAAQRILTTEARIDEPYIEQLYTFVGPDSAGDALSITVAYLALVPEDRFSDPLKASDRLALGEVIVPWGGETGGPAGVCSPTGEPFALIQDDADILGQAMLRLRGKLDYSEVGFALLPERFTLRQLQDVHEAILGVRLNKPAFRRRMLDKGWLEATGERETGASFRPAELYRYRPTKGA